MTVYKFIETNLKIKEKIKNSTAWHMSCTDIMLIPTNKEDQIESFWIIGVLNWTNKKYGTKFVRSTKFN